LVKKESYPLVEIDIQYIRYRWEAPEIKQRLPQHPFMKKLIRWENKLLHPNLAVRNTGDMNFIYRVKKSIESRQKEYGNSGLVKPLVVKQSHYGKDFNGKLYYVVVGNRRLLCLRGMQYRGIIPCIVALENDKWTDDTEGARLYANIKVDEVD